MAEAMESSYYIAENKPVPAFSSPELDTLLINKSIREEKIATSIAPFYALECGIGVIMDKYEGTPFEWLQKITSSKLDSAQELILNRFANATWKVGQPFRSLDRITRHVFISAYFLPAEEIKKDYDHIMAAATKLTERMIDVKGGSVKEQLKRITELLQDRQFALEMASNSEASFYRSQRHTVPPPFLNSSEDTATQRKSALYEKIAINIAGFYALECGLSYFATAKNTIPSTLLKNITDDKISAEDKRIFERFANATWKAGQPFRGLDRITRNNFISFDLLSDAEIEKDWIQIKAAASKLIPLVN
ncbi:hypothetical protein DC498_08045 [Terrimonas sp.]|nr:hypothetical protein DC498_08045 [Terrimonas sp.]